MNLSSVKFRVLVGPWCYHKPWNLLSSLVPCEWWYWSLSTYVNNKIVKMNCELTVSDLPCSSPLQLLLISFRNALNLVCLAPILYHRIISLSRKWEHICIHTYNAMREILADMHDCPVQVLHLISSNCRCHYHSLHYELYQKYPTFAKLICF